MSSNPPHEAMGRPVTPADQVSTAPPIVALPNPPDATSSTNANASSSPYTLPQHSRPHITAPTISIRKKVKYIWKCVRHGSSHGRRGNQKNPIWEKTVDVCIPIGNDYVKRPLVVLFDPHCPTNVISTRALARFKGVRYEPNDKQFATSITGREAFTSIGEVSLQWHCQKPRRHIGLTLGYYRNCYEDAVCQVVESEKFDLILGRETIDRLELYQAGHPIVACFIGSDGDKDLDKAKQDQDAADKSRAQAKDEKRKRDHEKKENNKKKKKN